MISAQVCQAAKPWVSYCNEYISITWFLWILPFHYILAKKGFFFVCLFYLQYIRTYLMYYFPNELKIIDIKIQVNVYGLWSIGDAEHCFSNINPVKNMQMLIH